MIKTLQIIVLFSFLFVACGSPNMFPVSNVVPAAEISIDKKQDDNNNYNIKLKAENLSSPQRLNPPKDVYVVWIQTDAGVKNIGQLILKDAKAELETITPYNFSEIFITAEDDGTVESPTGIEITRARF